MTKKSKEKKKQVMLADSTLRDTYKFIKTCLQSTDDEHFLMGTRDQLREFDFGSLAGSQNIKAKKA